MSFTLTTLKSFMLFTVAYPKPLVAMTSGKDADSLINSTQ